LISQAAASRGDPAFAPNGSTYSFTTSNEGLRGQPLFWAAVNSSNNRISTDYLLKHWSVELSGSNPARSPAIVTHGQVSAKGRHVSGRGNRRPASDCECYEIGGVTKIETAIWDWVIKALEQKGFVNT
jgi:hypothetical protein